MPNLTVIPNSTDLSVNTEVSVTRPVGHGVVISRLSELKRVDHAVRATIAAAGASTQPVSLDIYGDGDQRPALEQLIQAQGRSDLIRMHGHRDDARANLASASFLLLTSRSEAFALVLLESMAAGCIPIAYDVPYGPADIITHGRNGFLVPAGDEAALTETILTLQRLKPAQVTRMRQNAQRTARKFSDLAVTRLWARQNSARHAAKTQARQQLIASYVSSARSRVSRPSPSDSACSHVRPPASAIQAACPRAAHSCCVPAATRRLADWTRREDPTSRGVHRYRHHQGCGGTDCEIFHRVSATRRN